MIERMITPFVRELAAGYPIVTIQGPRQSGKTTLARHLFPHSDYVNLEPPDVRAEAKADMRGFLARHPAPAIFDEVQRLPELLSYLQPIVDETKRAGQYVLTGSHQPQMRAAVAQSLAGRTGLVDLLPLSVAELKASGVAKSRDAWMFDGFMPRLAEGRLKPSQLYRDYFRTYVERDALQLINLKDDEAFERFIVLLAGRVGQILNLSSLANDTGVSATTLKKWMAVLEASFIVFPLRPYYKNLGKRQIKAPKIYFTEPGLVAYLLGLRSEAQVGRDPLVGGLFENMVVVEILKARLNAGREPDMYFFRDSQGLEVDVVLAEGRHLRPIEIKSSYTYNADFSKNLRSFCALTKEAENPLVVYAGKDLPTESGVSFVNFENIAAAFGSSPA